ncbi:sugar ABC transporter permease protein [Clostridium sp. CAG:411]|mgnify:CR=1 FL=1|jgi:arabinogalactan oligomer/maltooligosaccharide transport system permease protein|nr:sugar ABC transporter permease [Lachnospiraceae bacterium]CDE42304.1 sugar ABC transporter permease protein [Clostridium sp. CAG:411]
MQKQETGSMKRNRFIGNTIVHVILTILSIIWLFPVVWIVLASFNANPDPGSSNFFPTSFGLQNYIKLFTETDQFYFVKWFGNTFLVAVGTCLLSTFYVLCVSYTLSRLRFKARKKLMNVGLILNMFPGFMSMIAVYYILKGIGLSESLVSLVFVYSAGQALQYHIAKGFFDTIPRAVDEAAWIDGATRFQVFYKITIPLSKPILIYTVLTSFMAPWIDFIFAKVILGTNYNKYTVAIGMWTMMQKEYIQTWYGRFTAAAVIVSIPISLLFLFMQKYYVEGMSAGAVKG